MPGASCRPRLLGCLPTTTLPTDGELYTGTVSSFQGNDPAITRSHSLRPTKTESSLNWLQGEAPPSPRSPFPQVLGVLLTAPVPRRPGVRGLSLHPREPGQRTG